MTGESEFRRVLARYEGDDWVYRLLHPEVLESCVHCGKVLHREIHDGFTFLIDDETGGDVCGSYGTYGNEPHVSSEVTS